VLTGLPPASSPVFVASLIHGGPVENISLPSPTSAFVLFLNPDDAVNFYKATANGIECVKEGVKYVVLCEMNAEEVDVVGGKLRMWIDMGMTRCVRAIGAIGQEWTLGKLYGLAEAKGRKVEVIEVGENPGGVSFYLSRPLPLILRNPLRLLQANTQSHSSVPSSSASPSSTTPSSSSSRSPGLTTGSTATSTSPRTRKPPLPYTPIGHIANPHPALRCADASKA